MAAGFLQRANLNSTSDTLLFIVSTASGAPQTFNLRFANRNAVPVAVRVAISASGSASPQLDEYVSYDIPIIANGIMEEIGLVASNGEKVFVRTSVAGVSVRAHGM